MLVDNDSLDNVFFYSEIRTLNYQNYSPTFSYFFKRFTTLKPQIIVNFKFFIALKIKSQTFSPNKLI